MSDQPSELAQLQTFLLDQLDRSDSDGSPVDLQNPATTPEYRAWLDMIDPHMAHLATRLIRKWGHRRGQSPCPGDRSA